MTTRDDVELLRSFARHHWSNQTLTRGVLGGKIADLIDGRMADATGCGHTLTELLHAAVRLYKDDSLRGVQFAKSDLAELCVTLNAVPMTVEQRKAVDSGLRKLGDAHRDGSERHAEIAIESITEEIGIHNYQDAARAVLATWRAAVQIREDQGLPTQPSAVAASAVNMAVAVARDFAAIGKLRGIFNTSPTAEGNSMLVRCAQEAHHSSAAGGYLLGIMAKWRAWNAGDPETVSQRRVLDILRAIRMPVDSGLFQAALTETIDVLDHMLDEIPF